MLFSGPLKGKQTWIHVYMGEKKDQLYYKVPFFLFEKQLNLLQLMKIYFKPNIHLQLHYSGTYTAYISCLSHVVLHYLCNTWIFSWFLWKMFKFAAQNESITKITLTGAFFPHHIQGTEIIMMGTQYSQAESQWSK